MGKTWEEYQKAWEKGLATLDLSITREAPSNTTVKLHDAGDKAGYIRSNDIYGVAYSPDGCLIVAGGADGIVRLWDVATKSCVAKLEGHQNEIKGVAYSPDGEQVASCSDNGTIRLWDVASTSCVARFSMSTTVWSVAYSPHGDQIISGSGDGIVRIWDVKKKHCVKEFKGHSSWVHCVAYSSNGQLIASGSRDSTVRLWDVDTGKCVFVFDGHSRSVYGVAFSPDGQQLATCGGDNKVHLWDLAKKQCVKTLAGHGSDVRGVAYSPDGLRLVIAGGAKVRLWNIAKESWVVTLKRKNFVWGVAYSPYNQCIAFCDRGEAIRLWSQVEPIHVQDLTGGLSLHDWLASVLWERQLVTPVALTTLILRNIALDDYAFSKLLTIIQQHPSLETLDLVGTGLSVEQRVTLIKQLKSNAALSCVKMKTDDLSTADVNTLDACLALTNYLHNGLNASVSFTDHMQHSYDNVSRQSSSSSLPLFFNTPNSNKAAVMPKKAASHAAFSVRQDQDSKGIFYQVTVNYSKLSKPRAQSLQGVLLGELGDDNADCFKTESNRSGYVVQLYFETNAGAIALIADSSQYLSTLSNNNNSTLSSTSESPPPLPPRNY